MAEASWVGATMAKVADELKPQRLVPNVVVGGVVGLLELVFAVALSALVFSGKLSGFAAQGLGLALLGTAVSCLCAALFSSLPGTLSLNQDIPATIIAVIAAAIAQALSPQLQGMSLFVTVVAVIALSTITTGIVFFVIGHFSLGNLVRFLPYSVLGGFLAGTGWLLVLGSVGLMTDLPLNSWQQIAVLGQSDMLLRWLPGVLFAFILMFNVYRFSHFLVLPGTIVAEIALFYLVARIGGTTLAELQNGGWLLGPFSDANLWPPLIWLHLSQVSWLAIIAQLPNLMLLVVLSTVALLLNVSGLEAATNVDIDLNREMKAAGIGSLGSGLLGGLIGYPAVSLSVLSVKMGGGRLAGVLVSTICLLALGVGAGTLSLFPKAVAGGVLFFLGLDFLKEWVYDAWKRLPHVEYGIVIFILLTIAVVGFLPGVAIGVVAAIVMFVVAYSRTEVVRHELNGQQMVSRVTRSQVGRQHLRAHGERLYILRLQGFIFFGTAEKLLNQVRERLQQKPVRYVVLDMARVTGLDSTGMRSLGRLRQVAEAHEAMVIITHATAVIQAQMARGGLAADGVVRYFRDLDSGLEWCENDLLALVQVEEATTLLGQLRLMLPNEPRLADLLPYLERQSVAAGTYLMHQGDAPDDLYFVESGQVTAQLEQPGLPPMRLETMGAGRVVGEMGYYLGQVRTASVVAEMDCVVYKLGRDKLRLMEVEAAEVASVLHQLIIRFLSERVTHLVTAVQALER
ncbi:MAG: SLC26A/SulP transporter family protein [Anaerolineales bacterium]|nr:SLC26A/SulP transporter family protein [Anaerolineales bacterium]